MITRMTTSMMASSSLASVQRNFARLADVNEQMSSGKRMKFASDDPASSVSSMRLRKELAATEQYRRNIDDAASWMQTADSAMLSVSDMYRKAKTTLIHSVNSANGPTSLRALAADLEQQAQAIMSQTNATYLGRTVFAGNSDKGSVFRPGVDAEGNRIFLPTEKDEVTAKPVNRRINANTILPANMDGNQIFGTGTIKWTGTPATTIDTSNNPSAMNLLTEAAKILRTGTLEGENVDKLLAIQNQLDKKAQDLYEGMSTLGARHKQVIEAQDNIVGDLQAVKKQLSDVENVDIQAATIEMSLANMAYQASLSSTQRVVQPSLLDYLR